MHEGLVLLHLPERLEVRDRQWAVAAGGRLLVEDIDDVTMPTIDGTGVHHDLIAKSRTAFTELLRSEAPFSDFGAHALRSQGNAALLKRAQAVASSWTWAEPFVRVLAASAALLYDALFASAITLMSTTAIGLPSPIPASSSAVPK